MGDSQLSTGLPGLDRVLCGLIPGDNVVWQVDSIADYAPPVAAFCAYARAKGRKLVYFRFGDHEPLVSDEAGVDVCRLDVSQGFEPFITEIHRAVNRAGRRAYLVFDCLSTLAVDWNSDRMLGNFFLLTCPYILDLESLAYFAVQRGCHSFHANAPISETTQIFLDVYRRHGELYVQPIKVQHRYSPTMYTLHAWKGGEFLPVLDSSTTADVLTSMPWGGMDSARLRLGVWNRRFFQAEEAWSGLQSGQRTPEEVQPFLRMLLRTAISRDDRVLQLAEKYLSLGDVLAVGKRMIGTGLIGGKAVGMLLARAILKRDNPRWDELLEAHDSFFIGSDVFFTFLVENGCWWLRQKQRDPATFLDGVEEARRRILTGRFPEYIHRELAEMLDYFGQSPIIVRSSSLLEDSFGNAFAGKYESVFCANQGPHQKRLEDFLSAVRTIYASAMSEKALRYRAQRGILGRDEQMSLLVQRVSGTRHGTLFYPHVAGVGLSFNPYVWSPYIDPEAGMVRMVFGLGTRAVDRSDDDYTRVVALNAPDRRPEAGPDEVRRYSQRWSDVIDLEANQLVSVEFTEVARRSPNLPIDLFASEDHDLAQWAADRKMDSFSTRMLTFDRLLSETPFIADAHEMLMTLQSAYGCPVDTEFTANYFPDGHKINLVQCRPLQISGCGTAVSLPPDLQASQVVLRAAGAVIGRSRRTAVDRLVYIVPSVYGELALQDRYAVARLIGRIMHADGPRAPKCIVLIGPGRWGTTTPSLGVPVSFAEIDTVSVLCEIVAMRDDLVPDVSLGTHFFNELVELDILYMALFPARRDNGWNREFFESQAANRLLDVVSDAADWAHAVRVIDFPRGDGGGSFWLNADALQQQVLCYVEG